jgi:hypothetical protein
MILSDNESLRSHAYGGVDLDEIIESGILHELPECLDYCRFGVGEGSGGGGTGAGGVRLRNGFFGTGLHLVVGTG